MTRPVRRPLACAAALVAVLVAGSIMAGCAERATSADRATATGGAKKLPGPRLTPLASRAELTALLGAQAEKHRRALEAVARSRGMTLQQYLTTPSDVMYAIQAASEPSITNVQHAGVDEGGIVKVHGDHLIILRRGRLFTVRIGDGSLTPIATVDAFGPDVDPADAWYDEMLVSENTIVVVGYSYARGGSELGLFDIDRAGGMRYRATYHLRSGDYYSSRNYASRLLGRKLVFYTPIKLVSHDEQVLWRSLPALRTWRASALESAFTPIYAPERLYRPLSTVDHLVLHTVVACDLGAPDLECEAIGVFGPEERVFYVSPSAVYIWASAGRSGRKPGGASWLYRLPLDGGEPGALAVSGTPVDQFSFLEERGFLNVLVGADAEGDRMWRSEDRTGALAMLRFPISSFAAAVETVAPSRYRALLTPPLEDGTFQNRFVGGYFLYGMTGPWRPSSAATARDLFVYRYADRSEPSVIRLDHGVDRIEALGSHAVVVGTDRAELHVSSIRLRGRPALAGRYTRRDTTQGEQRSHGFFYKVEGPSSGMIGLPIHGPGRSRYRHLVEGSASLLFLRNEALRLTELGTLDAQPDTAGPDACRASCIDWYGNARPLFVHGRIFALLGYEIVEGELVGRQIRERRRVSFAPSPEDSR